MRASIRPGARQTEVFVGQLPVSPATQFTVQAIGAHGLSTPGTTQAVEITPGLPSMPTNLQAEVAGTQATLTWDPPVDDGGSPVVDYVVTWSDWSGQHGQVTVTDTTATLSDLEYGQAYYISVRARTAAGHWGHLAYSYVSPFTTSEPPRDLRIRPDDSALDVHWETPPDDNGAYIQGYTVTAMPGSHSVEVDGLVQQARLTGLDNDVDYTVTVTARNEAGDSAPSEPLIGRPISSGVDSDGDTLPDVLEFRVRSNHLLPDTDDDGLRDAFEVLRLVSHSSPAAADADDNGVIDADEDADGDGRTNLQEQTDDTDPTTPDTDEDALTDGAEAAAGTNPLLVDTDQDGVTDGLEIELALDPLAASSDPQLPDAQRAVDRQVSTESSTVAAHGTPQQLADLRLTERPGLVVPGAVSRVAVVHHQPAANAATGSDAQATLTSLAIDVPAIVSATTTLAVAAQEPTGTWTLTAKQFSISTDRTSVTVHAPDLGVSYAVVDLDGWRDRLTACNAALTGRPAPLDIEVILDATGSVYTEDPSGERFHAAQTVLSTLDAGDDATLRMFSYIWVSAGFGGYNEPAPTVTLPEIEAPQV